MRSLALALGLPSDHFTGRLTRQPTMLFRIFHYPPGVGVGEHSDYGLLTLLRQDAQGGLEVRPREGGWIDVPPRGGALVITSAICSSG